MLHNHANKVCHYCVYHTNRGTDRPSIWRWVGWWRQVHYCCGYLRGLGRRCGGGRAFRCCPGQWSARPQDYSGPRTRHCTVPSPSSRTLSGRVGPQGVEAPPLLLTWAPPLLSFSVGLHLTVCSSFLFYGCLFPLFYFLFSPSLTITYCLFDLNLSLRVYLTLLLRFHVMKEKVIRHHIMMTDRR